MQLTELGRTEIIQINATVIAGALILLTLSGISDSGNILPLNRSVTTYAALIVISPFALSSLEAIKGNLTRATRLLQRGFYVILGILVALFVFQAMMDVLTYTFQK